MTSTNGLTGDVHKRFLISEDISETRAGHSFAGYLYSRIQRVLLEPVTFIVLVWTIMIGLVYACFLFTD
jgi:hypothetical protein